jgi:hypothetical protein
LPASGKPIQAMYYSGYGFLDDSRQELDLKMQEAIFFYDKLLISDYSSNFKT